MSSNEINYEYGYFMGIPDVTSREEKMLQRHVQLDSLVNRSFISCVGNNVIRRSKPVHEVAMVDLLNQKRKEYYIEYSPLERHEFNSGVLEGYAFTIGCVALIMASREPEYREDAEFPEDTIFDFIKYRDRNKLPFISKKSLSRIHRVIMNEALAEDSETVDEKTKNDKLSNNSVVIQRDAANLLGGMAAIDRLMDVQAIVYGSTNSLDSAKTDSTVQGFRHGVFGAISMYVQDYEERVLTSIYRSSRTKRRIVSSFRKSN